MDTPPAGGVVGARTEVHGMALAHCSGLCFLQIMIEFCPGGAVDAIMLGKFPFGCWGGGTSP